MRQDIRLPGSEADRQHTYGDAGRILLKGDNITLIQPLQ
jgi:small nuclear ribonucleoprotein (snRNP)-like protein